MQINTAPASDGVRWVTDGFKLLLKQPLALPAMTVLFVFMHLPVVVPVVGAIAAAMLSPFATVGLMTACREIAAGRMPAPLVYLRPFQDAPQRRRLFRLGSVNAVLTVLVALLITLAGVGETLATAESASPTAADIRWDNLGWQVLLYLPVVLLMWFAPMLVGWHGAGPAKAMFGSLVACWRNKSAMLMFFLAVSAVVFATTMLVSALLDTFGTSIELASMLVAPAVLVLLGVVQAGIYVMYTTVIGTD